MPVAPQLPETLFPKILNIPQLERLLLGPAGQTAILEEQKLRRMA